jgi:predicted enzyme related to lactoylglutathione lyase
MNTPPDFLSLLTPDISVKITHILFILKQGCVYMGKTNPNAIIKDINIVIDCPDASVLAEFYSKLLGWEIIIPHNNGWAAVSSPEGRIIAFQDTENYERPVWPNEKGIQGQMLHLDFVVDNLTEGVNHALNCGAKLHQKQFYSTSQTMLDPAGHTFCIDTSEE